MPDSSATAGHPVLDEVETSPSDGPLATGRHESSIEDILLSQLKDRVVIMLLFNQKVSKEHVMRHWLQWRDGGRDGDGSLWRCLARDPNLNRAAVFEEAAAVYAFQEDRFSMEEAEAFVETQRDRFTTGLWRRFQERKLMPVRLRREPGAPDSGIVFVTHDPSHPDVTPLLRRAGIQRYVLRFAPEARVDELVKRCFTRRNEYLERARSDEDGVQIAPGYEEESGGVADDLLEAEISRSALVNLFEAMLIEAVRERASDIHIVHNENNRIEISFRKQGELEHWHEEDRFHPDAFAAVVKDNAINVDRFERDAAQDGFIQRQIDDALIRFRVSVLPITTASYTARSESIVIRVLDDRSVPDELAQLGMNPQDLARLEDAVAQPYGMVILTGPTGSGKSTTLYAALQQVVTPKVNVLTVEDPVEYVLPRVRQIKLNHKLGFEQALRSILRHDPDIVMLGEIRDRVTAEVAVKIANTGHLAFSTLHTNDAPSAISRLYKIGVEPFLIAYAVNIIVAQRLIRVLCPACRHSAGTLDARTARLLGLDADDLAGATLYAADEQGCPECHHGYTGRRAITETLVFTDEIRELILTAGERIDEHAVRRCALEQGMRTLTDAARELVLTGETSPMEMLRVVATAR